METALLDIAAHNLQNRTIALIENGSWAPTAGKLMRGILSKLKDVTILNEMLTHQVLAQGRSACSACRDRGRARGLHAEAAPDRQRGQGRIPPRSSRFQYGLFALSAREGDKDNACIINTAIQMANKPEASPSRSSRPTTPAA